MYLLSTETLETKRIPNSPKCVGEGLPAFSHNGEYLAYWCFREAYERRSIFLTASGRKAEDDYIISGFSKWVDVVG